LQSVSPIGDGVPGPACLEFVEILRRDGLVLSHNPMLTPLTDGVSSEIYRVDDGEHSFVVKRALPQLKVRDEWLADISRNRYEQMYIEYVSSFLPGSVPRLLHGAEDRGYFAMELLGAEFTSWKRLLLRGDTSMEHATQAGALLGRIHARSAGDREVERRFRTTPNFMQLRIDPYLLTTGIRHPDLRPIFQAEAERLASTRECLVHGDFSPKNILISPARMVLLDCEVAWYGDPAFDAAFLLTHLLLKGLYHAPRQLGLEAMSREFWRSYTQQIGRALDPRRLSLRVARLLLLLLLARVDGKSPVEYLIPPRQTAWVRQFTRAQIPKPDLRLEEVIEQWFAGVLQMQAEP
jgi:aminoglycoside phosphotransferase (APT) family kinase protein